MKKEALTKQACLADLKAGYRSNFVAAIIYFLSLTAFGGLLAGAFSQGWVFGVGLLLGVICLIVFIIIGIKLHRQTVTNDFYLVTDKLVGLEEKSHYRRSRGLYETYHLHFASYGEYQIPENNYQWSEMFPLSDRSVFMFAHSGDRFYILLTPSKKYTVRAVYNINLFELSETDFESIAEAL